MFIVCYRYSIPCITMYHQIKAIVVIKTGMKFCTLAESTPWCFHWLQRCRYIYIYKRGGNMPTLATMKHFYNDWSRRGCQHWHSASLITIMWGWLKLAISTEISGGFHSQKWRNYVERSGWSATKAPRSNSWWSSRFFSWSCFDGNS